MNIKVEYTYFIDENEIIKLYELDHYSTEYDMEKAFWGYIAGMDDGSYYDLINKEAQFVEVAKKKLKYTFIGFDYEKEQYGQDKDWWIVKENMIVIPNDFVDTFDFATFKKKNEKTT